jgi:hypothetical protein
MSDMKEPRLKLTEKQVNAFLCASLLDDSSEARRMLRDQAIDVAGCLGPLRELRRAYENEVSA